MKNVHGKFNSFVELGKALGIKVPQNVEKERKCSNSETRFARLVTQMFIFVIIPFLRTTS